MQLEPHRQNEPGAKKEPTRHRERNEEETEAVSFSEHLSQSESVRYSVAKRKEEKGKHGVQEAGMAKEDDVDHCPVGQSQEKPAAMRQLGQMEKGEEDYRCKPDHIDQIEPEEHRGTDPDHTSSRLEVWHDEPPDFVNGQFDFPDGMREEILHPQFQASLRSYRLVLYF